MHIINLSPSAVLQRLCFNTFKLISVCCVFRTGQCVCGRWTATVVRCTVWPRAPATLMLWAPSAAPGKTPAVTQVFLITCTSTDNELGGKCLKKKGEFGEWSSIFVYVCVQVESVLCSVWQSGLYREGVGSAGRLVYDRGRHTPADPSRHREGTR